MRTYRAKNGDINRMPTFKEAVAIAREGKGWCVNCGVTVENVDLCEERAICPRCGKPKVYGMTMMVAYGMVY